MASLSELYPVSSSDGLDYQSRSSNFIAAVNTLYSVDVSSTPVTVTLPESPSIGNRIKFVDKTGVHPQDNSYPAGFGLNALTITPNTGQTIQGIDDSLLLDVDSTAVELQWDGNRWMIVSVVNKNEAALDRPDANIKDSFNLSEAADYSGTASDGDILKFNGTSGKWEATSPVIKVFEAYAATAGQTSNGPVAMDTVRHSSSIAQLSSGAVEILETGLYSVAYRLTTNNNNTSSRSSSRGYLNLNGLEVVASTVWNYNREYLNNNGLTTGGADIILSLSNGDNLELMWEEYDDCFVVDGACNIRLIKLA